MTKVSLAKASSISTRSLSDFESGAECPSLATQEALARALDFPVSFFEGPDVEELDAGGVSFRSLKKMTAGQREAALAAGSIALELNSWIDSKFGLPPSNVPDLGQFPPEEAAVALRAHWDQGERPIKSMVHLLESKGVRVYSLAERCTEVDAYSFWKGNVPFVFLNTMKSAERSRFDAAHELGHLVLHWHGEPQGREAEQQANEFAAAFLMPSASIMAHAPQMPTLEGLVRLKSAWNVSVAALAHRLHDLGCVSDWHYRTLCIEIAQQGFRKSEPNGSSHETSQVLQKVFAALRNEGVSKSDIVRELRISVPDLDALVFGLVMTPVNGERQTTGRPSVPPKLELVP